MSCSDWINVLGIIVNSFLAIWVVRILQNNLANQRALKDHLINEVIEVKDLYSIFIKQLVQGELSTKSIIPELKLLNVKTNAIIEILNKEYSIEKDRLQAYQIDLREFITELDEFTRNYRNNNLLELEHSSINEIIRFQQKHSKKFNQIILEINKFKP